MCVLNLHPSQSNTKLYPYVPFLLRDKVASNIFIEINWFEDQDTYELN